MLCLFGFVEATKFQIRTNIRIAFKMFDKELPPLSMLYEERKNFSADGTKA